LLTLGVAAISDSRRVAQDCAVFTAKIFRNVKTTVKNRDSFALVEWSKAVGLKNVSKARLFFFPPHAQAHLCT
jgi:hypothetical protein